MLRQEDHLMILLRRREGVSVKDIAEEFGVSTKTVSRTLKRGGPPPRTRRSRGSLLAPFTAKLDELMANNVWNGRVMPRWNHRWSATSRARDRRAVHRAARVVGVILADVQQRG